MRKSLLFTGIVTIALQASGVPLKVCDFEDFEVGTQWTLWQSSGAEISSTATVETDPQNASNKVLHIVLKDWGCQTEFVIPTDLRGKALTDRYTMVTYDLFRSESETDNWKKFMAYVGDEQLYCDDGYPEQGQKGVWQTRTYNLASASDSNQSNLLRLGIHHNNSDYYIDNVVLSGPFDSFVTLENGQTLDLCVDNTSSNYTKIDKDLLIPAGVTASVRGSRYSEWTGKVAGTGTLNIYSGGERFYMGTASSKGATVPDWSAMTGDIHVYPYKEVNAKCGFYGLLMNSGTFQPDNVEGSRTNELFADNRVILHAGAKIAVESGTRGIRIGELNTEEGSELDGYYRKSSASSYYIIGKKNTDGTLAGKISASNGNKIGLIKEGSGSLTITGNDNDINGGIRVLEGRLVIANDAEAAKADNKKGAVGTSGTIFLFKKASLSGTGNISAPVEVYGTVLAGSESQGTLRFANYTSVAQEVKVTLHPEAKLVCKIKNTGEYASIDIAGSLLYNSQTEDFENSEKKPRLAIELADGADLKAGDELTLLTASKTDGDWNFDIRYPKAYTWKVEQRKVDDGSMKVVAIVESLKYTGQGDIVDDDEHEGGKTEYPDDDWSADLTDNTPLCEYARKLGKHVGVAIATYRYDCSGTEGPAGIVSREFNMLVGENEMKFDATEPSRNNFNFGGSDAVMYAADRASQTVRGHTLAWHSQVAQWVSKDGNKNDNNFSKRELLDILKNHIFNVVGKYKGRIVEWDVCNEVLDDDQSIVRTNPTAYKLRPSIWATYIGEEFIDSAFVWAHQADPQAKLYINDYGVEFAGDTKSEAYFNLVKRLKASNLPIEGCGLQCHLTTGQLDTLKLERNIRRYDEIGLKCIITELDIALADPSAADALDLQAKEYGAITRIFLRNDNCPDMLVWGISDNHSWRHNQPLLFDKDLNPKPAYYNVHAQMRLAAEKLEEGGIGSIESNATPVKVVYFDVNGRIVKRPTGFVIEKRIYSDGSVKAVKKIFR